MNSWGCVALNIPWFSRTNGYVFWEFRGMPLVKYCTLGPWPPFVFLLFVVIVPAPSFLPLLQVKRVQVILLWTQHYWRMLMKNISLCHMLYCVRIFLGYVLCQHKHIDVYWHLQSWDIKVCTCMSVHRYSIWKLNRSFSQTSHCTATYLNAEKCLCSADPSSTG